MLIISQLTLAIYSKILHSAMYGSNHEAHIEAIYIIQKILSLALFMILIMSCMTRIHIIIYYFLMVLKQA